MSSGISGLYKHAKEIRSRTTQARRSDELSTDERAQIETQIDSLFQNRSLVPDDASETPSPRKGILFPALVNLVVLGVFIGALWIIVLPEWETALEGTSESGALLTTEGFVVERVQEQAAEEVAAMETRVAQIQRQLEVLRREGRTAETGEAGAAEAALQAELERLVAEIEDQRTRAVADAEERATLASTEMQQRLNTLEERRLEASFLVEQVGFAFEAIPELLAAGDFEGADGELNRVDRLVNAASPTLSDPYSEMVATLGYGITTLRVAVQSLRDANAAPDTVIPLAAALTRARDLKEEADRRMDGGDDAAALQLYREALSALPTSEGAFAALESAWIAERQALMDEQTEAEGVHAQVLAAVRTDLSRVREETARAREETTQVREETAQVRNELNRRIAAFQEEVDALRAANAETRSRLVRKEESQNGIATTIRREIHALSDAVGGGSTTEAGSEPPDIAELLETKIIIREVLDSETVRGEYPDLYGRMEQYIAALSDEKERTGRREGLKTAITTIRDLSARLEITPTAADPTPSDNVDVDLAATLVSELSHLLEGVIGEIE